jgi:hypothetical protein
LCNGICFKCNDLCALISIHNFNGKEVQSFFAVIKKKKQINMKTKLAAIAIIAFMIFESSCTTTVAAGRPAPRHYWWHHHPVQREVIIVR